MTSPVTPLSPVKGILKDPANSSYQRDDSWGAFVGKLFGRKEPEKKRSFKTVSINPTLNIVKIPARVALRCPSLQKAERVHSDSDSE
jgi:hypothetical protein